MELYSLLAVFQDSDKSTTKKIVKLLIKEGLLNTIVPLNILEKTDEELVNTLNSPLLRKALSKGVTKDLPRLLFIYDSIPNSLSIDEVVRYLAHLSPQQKQIYLTFHRTLQKLEIYSKY